MIRWKGKSHVPLVELYLWKIREGKAYVSLRGLYLRKGRGERNRMYSRVNCTCGKEDGGESVCITAGIVPAEREGRAKPHVPLWGLYLRERWGGRMGMYARAGAEICMRT